MEDRFRQRLELIKSCETVQQTIGIHGIERAVV
jgi:hypothetical protein